MTYATRINDGTNEKIENRTVKFKTSKRFINDSSLRESEGITSKTKSNERNLFEPIRDNGRRKNNGIYEAYSSDSSNVRGQDNANVLSWLED